MQFGAIPPLSLLVGARLDGVERREFDWVFLFSGGVGVIAENSHWRLVAGNRIILTDEDHGHLFGQQEPVDAAKMVQAELSGAAICKLEISAVSDLLLFFSNKHVLQVNIGSGGYENWHVRGPDGSHAFAIGGGELCRTEA